MSIENCPLSQIPVEIVAGGPSLVIQVMPEKIKLRCNFPENKVLFPVFENARPLPNYVKLLYQYGGTG